MKNVQLLTADEVEKLSDATFDFLKDKIFALTDTLTMEEFVIALTTVLRQCESDIDDILCVHEENCNSQNEDNEEGNYDFNAGLN